MFSNLKHVLIRQVVNTLGWRANRRIVVIESDDWGSIRMPSKDVYNRLLKAGFAVDADPYCKYDSLASHDDLESLFEILTTVKDKNGHYPVMTANCVMANPDFERIKGADFMQYYYEPITETFKRYPKCRQSFNLWEEGKKTGIFHLQLHGREHLNVNRWMNELLKNDYAARLQFDNFCWGLTPITSHLIKKNFLSAFSGVQQTEAIEIIIAEGVKLFYDLFGYYPQSFIAPCYVWNNDVENILSRHNIKYLQGNYFQSISDFKNETKHKSRLNYLGKRNTNKQLYLVRNCFFEPGQNEQADWVNSCLKEIAFAFKHKKPAIISMHRLNFIGSIFVENRDKNLILLERLLKSIVSNWPDVEFITSDCLGDLINDMDEKDINY